MSPSPWSWWSRMFSRCCRDEFLPSGCRAVGHTRSHDLSALATGCCVLRTFATPPDDHCIGRHLTEYLCTHFLSAVLREFELIPLHEVVVSFSATVSVTPSSVPVRLVPGPVRAGAERSSALSVCP
jgi:hypothetical protein